MRMSNRIALMREGRLLQAGTAEEIYHAPADINAARMFSDMNEIPVVVKSSKAETPFGNCKAGGIKNGNAVACIRQRDVQLVPLGKGRAGRVLNTRFLGETALMEIGVAGLEEPLFARVRESRAKQAGTEVGVKVDPGDILVFAAASDDKR
jgi:iron(III) transport system ATP-binding protein